MLARLAPELRRCVLRNRLLTVLSNERWPSLVARLPAIVGAEVALWAFVARWDPRSVAAHVRALPSTVVRGLRRRRELRSTAARAGPPAIAVVITKLELGGAQQVALAVAREMSRRGVRVIFVANDEGLLRPACEAIPDLVRYFLPSLVREVRPAADVRAYRQLKRIFRREGVDLVHTHSSKAGVLGRLAARAVGVPRVVHTVHGFGFHDAQPWIARAVFVGIERLAARATHRFVLVSRENLERGERDGVLDRRRAVIIRAGVDLDAFRRRPEGGERLRRELGLSSGSAVVGTVACLKPQKAPLDFVAVAERIVKERPETTFLLVGDGELRDEVESAIAGRGLSARVRLLGWRHDVPELMSTFDLFLLTSHWEGLPMVLPQARASGLPIVATDVNGNREAVTEGRHGLLRPAGDVAGLADACLALLADPERRQRMGAAGREGLDEFSEGAMLRAHVALYEELLGRPLPERR